MKIRTLVVSAALSALASVTMAQPSTQQMPGGRGEMADHPHATRGPGSARPMQPQRNNMPAGEGEMPDHPHGSSGGRANLAAPIYQFGGELPGGRGEMPNYPYTF